jgi:hypothetical protein
MLLGDMRVELNLEPEVFEPGLGVQAAISGPVADEAIRSRCLVAHRTPAVLDDLGMWRVLHLLNVLLPRIAQIFAAPYVEIARGVQALTKGCVGLGVLQVLGPASAGQARSGLPEAGGKQMRYGPVRLHIHRFALARCAIPVKRYRGVLGCLQPSLRPIKVDQSALEQRNPPAE